MSTDDSLFSSYREFMFENIFLAELMREAWRTGKRRLEVLKPCVDDSGYDLVVSSGAHFRHIQLKASMAGSKVRSFSINSNLANKNGGCVIFLAFSEQVEIASIYWFGNAVGKDLPDLSTFPLAKHTKGNSLGEKLVRPGIRKVPLSKFKKMEGVASLVEELFGFRNNG